MANEPMYQKIYGEMLAKIKDGTYPVGSRLPSEKELTELYQVSRITAKKAVELLSYQGCILRKPGKGSFVISQGDVDSLFPEENVISEETEQKEYSDQPIGVIFDAFSPSFGCELLRGIEYECRKRGFLMYFRCSYGSREEENRAIREMMQHGVKGLLLMSAQGENYNKTVLELYVNKYPLILLDRKMAGISLPVVTTDNYQASCDLVEKLIEQGHKKICFVSHSSINTSTVEERFSGYRDTMLKNMLQTDESMWITDVNQYVPKGDDDCWEDGLADSKLADYIMNHQDVTAYLAIEQEIGMFLFRIMRKLGVDEEKTIAYFDGFDETIDPFPLFTHVMQDQYQMGVVAVRCLVHRLRGEKVVGRENIPYSIVMGR